MRWQPNESPVATGTLYSEWSSRSLKTSTNLYTVTVPVELKYVAFLSVNRNEAHNLVSLVILDFMFLFMFCHCTFM